MTQVNRIKDKLCSRDSAVLLEIGNKTRRVTENGWGII
jgi:hypothetical protein